MVQRHKDSTTSLIALSFTFISNACHLPLSGEFFYRTSTHSHSHSPQASLSPSCIILTCFKNHYLIRTFLKNSFDKHLYSFLPWHEWKTSVSPTSLCIITSFCYSQLLILFTHLLPTPIFFKKKSAIGFGRYYGSTNRGMLSSQNKKLVQNNLPLTNPCHISWYPSTLLPPFYKIFIILS